MPVAHLLPVVSAEPRPLAELTQDFALWKRDIRRAIGDLCALERQLRRCDRAAGCCGEDFRHALRALYATNHFAEFLSFEAWRQAGLDEGAGRELDALRQQLDAYDEPDSDAALFSDPAWQAIIKQVKKVLALL